ncbi:MAG: ROK family protein [Elusimicrobiota bacterium]|jgi:glucokinase|nr:ROK family protein [Elusimicrobiota bacterium]
MIAIGIDIGGTFIKFFAVDSKLKIIKSDSIPTYTKLNAEAFLSKIAEKVKIWAATFKDKNIVLGLGLPGDTDPVKGILRFAPNIPWSNLKVKEILSKKTGFKCFVSNDANMAAWGVHAGELAAKYSNLIVITMGTGIGCGLIVDGKLYQGASGSAGEFGHMKIAFGSKSPLCGCGAHGCVEAFIGSKAIRRMVAAASAKKPKSILAKLFKEEEFSVNILSVAAAKGDESALEIWREIGLHLGRAIANMVLLFNPQAIVLAGGVSRGAKYFMAEVKKVFAEQTVKTPFKNLKILLSKEGNVGGIGAALYALSKADEE